MKRKIMMVILSLTLVMSLAACGSSEESSSGAAEEEETLDLTGVWQSEVTDGAYMEATISGETITVNWMDEEDETSALYWIGTYIPPTESTDEYDWESQGDVDQMSTALLASSDETKEFSYSNGDLSFPVSALGTTTTMHMTLTSETVPETTADTQEEESEDEDYATKDNPADAREENTVKDYSGTYTFKLVNSYVGDDALSELEEMGEDTDRYEAYDDGYKLILFEYQLSADDGYEEYPLYGDAMLGDPWSTDMESKYNYYAYDLMANAGKDYINVELQTGEESTVYEVWSLPEEVDEFVEKVVGERDYYFLYTL